MITYEILGFALPWERKKIAAGVEHFRRVASDPALYTAITHYQNRFGQNRFHDTALIPGEVSVKVKSRWMNRHNLKIQMIANPFYPAVAYYANGVLHLGRKHFYRCTVEQVGGTLAHEDLHDFGFRHDYYPDADRPDSVPYSIGRMVARWKL